MDPQLEESANLEHLLGRVDQRPGGVLMQGDTWDEIMSKSMADRKLTLYGSYAASRR
jgi:hypothetical protein